MEVYHWLMHNLTSGDNHNTIRLCNKGGNPVSFYFSCQVFVNVREIESFGRKFKKQY